MKASCSFDNCCRICGCKHNITLVSIFSSEDLLEKITSCLLITIHEADLLPHQICNDCLKSVEQYYQLVNKAQSSETYFLSCLKNNPPIQDEPKLKTENDDVEEEQDDNVQSMSLDLQGSFQCDLCGQLLSKASDLSRHIQEKHVTQSMVPPNTEFTINKICSLCGQLFGSEQSYYSHKSESSNQCPNCEKRMPSKCLLNRHIQHGCKQLHFCPHCHRGFAAKMSFLKHVQDHTGEKFESDCLACDRKCKNKEEVVEHTCVQADRNSPTDKRYRCYVCGLTYKRQLNLQRHYLQHEPKTTWKYKCTKCNDVFEKEKKLQTHYERVHKMARSWVCRFCGKSLSTKLSVQIHERIHTKVKPFVCEWCGKPFRCRPNLIQHQATHTGIRPHKCHICGKKFSRPFFLQTHLRIHTGERPYECEICERRFTQLTDMRRHRKRHDKKVLNTISIVGENSREVIEEETLNVSIDSIELKIETTYT